MLLNFDSFALGSVTTAASIVPVCNPHPIDCYGCFCFPSWIHFSIRSQCDVCFLGIYPYISCSLIYKCDWISLWRWSSRRGHPRIRSFCLSVISCTWWPRARKRPRQEPPHGFIMFRRSKMEFSGNSALISVLARLTLKVAVWTGHRDLWLGYQLFSKRG